MQGQITKFRDDLGIGIIAGADGRKYRFTKSAVVNLWPQLIGQDVDFLLAARRPTDIIVMAGSPWTVFGGTEGA